MPTGSVRGVLAELVIDAHHLITRCVGRYDTGADAALAASESVTAKTITVPACWPEMMNCLAPLIT
jgi:hypothetical protein